jgi:hypothetical protein
MAEVRHLAWVILWFVGGYASYWMHVAESQSRFDAGDKSAFAWMGFLPFLVPIFMMHSAIVVFPVAIVVEIALWIRFWHLSNKGKTK